MLRYNLRTLLIVLALGPGVLFVVSLVWFAIMVHFTNYPPRVKEYPDSSGQTGLRRAYESANRTRAELRDGLRDLDDSPWRVVGDPNLPAPGTLPPPSGAFATGGPFSAPPDAPPPTIPVELERRTPEVHSPFSQD
ncbi:MAG TPA: hypothetical protein VFV87_05615 [Pirellulaceae bacterium]|nr:hypothetical protein [Pirellulaceae bacterium]